MSTILDEIVASKRQEIAKAKSEMPEGALRQRLADAPPTRDFLAAISDVCDKRDDNRHDERDSPIFADTKIGTVPAKIGTVPAIRLIAEVKKASPSKGVIRADFDPVEIALIYQAHGASCLSVLTDEPFFQGSLENLRRVRAAVDLPVLRKDFIVDSYQVIEARAAGADAVLLIAECLDDEMLEKLYGEILDLGMTPLVELHEPANLARVLRVGARLIGINNRDLRTFKTDLEHTLRLRRQIPADRVVVGESGIRTRSDVERLEAAGVQAMLVGETLLARPDIAEAVDELLGTQGLP